LRKTLIKPTLAVVLEVDVTLLPHQMQKISGFVFINGVINSWNSLPAQCVNCNTVDTFTKYVSIALESETDVNS